MKILGVVLCSEFTAERTCGFSDSIRSPALEAQRPGWACGARSSAALGLGAEWPAGNAAAELLGRGNFVVFLGAARPCAVEVRRTPGGRSSAAFLASGRSCLLLALWAVVTPTCHQSRFVCRSFLGRSINSYHSRPRFLKASV